MRKRRELSSIEYAILILIVSSIIASVAMPLYANLPTVEAPAIETMLSGTY